ncbi:hypothetical protein [Streptomyces omiyaensis]|uniref:Transposase n=1 Tax=Streptomyces omiyaensis TaxID=68247 RepID=A0ABW7C1T3_9ACTN
MVKCMGIVWNLRRLMAERDMFQTADLIPALAEHGVHLSREQVYRLASLALLDIILITTAAILTRATDA